VNFWKVILATVVIFGAGVFTGGLLVNQVQQPHPRNNHRPSTNGESRESQSRTNNLANLSRPPRTPDILGTNFVQQLDDALQLAPDQLASIQKIIADGQERNHAIWTNNSAQMREVIQDVRHRVRETLTADQQKQFEDLMKQRSSKPTFNERLESTKRLNTNIYGLTPEQQMQKMDAERLRALSNASQSMPSPPPVVLPPAPAN
jgi:hypothetical protein